MSHCLNEFALVTNQTKLNIFLELVHIFNKRYMFPCNDIKWIISFLQQWKLGVTHLSYQCRRCETDCVYSVKFLQVLLRLVMNDFTEDGSPILVKNFCNPITRIIEHRR